MMRIKAAPKVAPMSEAEGIDRTSHHPHLNVMASVNAKCADIIGSLALLALLLAITITVIGRAIDIDINKAYEVSRYSAVWLGMAGAAYLASQRGHVSAGIALERFLHGRPRQAVIIARFMGTALFLLLLLWTGAVQVINSFESGATTLSTTRWPIWPAQVAVPLFAFSWFAAMCLPAQEREG